MGPNLKSKGENHECSEDHTNRRHRRRRKLCSPDSRPEHRRGLGISGRAEGRTPCDEGVLAVLRRRRRLCTVTVSNLGSIQVGSRVLYSQAMGFRWACRTAPSFSTRGMGTERLADARSTSRRASDSAPSRTGPAGSPGSRPVSMSRARGPKSSAPWMARTASLHRMIDRQQRRIRSDEGGTILSHPRLRTRDAMRRVDSGLHRTHSAARLGSVGEASLDYKQRLQELSFPKGIAFDGNWFESNRRNGTTLHVLGAV